MQIEPFQEGKSSVFTEEDTELTFLCVCVGGTMLVGGRGAGRGFGTGLGRECNSPQHPLCSPEGRTEGMKPPKTPPGPVNQTKSIAKESEGISAQQELKPKLAGASH